jgi:hypothetical protein
LKSLIARAEYGMVIKCGALMVISSRIVLTGLAAVLIIVVVFSAIYPSTQAQTNTTFTSKDKFSIPELHGSISFSVNGSYSEATLQNGTWIFSDLRLNNSQPLRTLKISAENSNVTVYSYRANQFGATNQSFRSITLRYTVEGLGKQTVNLGLNSSQPTSPTEWTITVPDKGILAEGNGWQLLPDNSIVVTGLTGNVSISHFTYNMPTTSGPFYVQHSIAIITAAVVAATIAVAAVIRVKVRT